MRRPNRRAVSGGVATLAAAACAVVALPASTAHAGSWTTLSSFDGSVLLACKTPEEGGYGPVWKVTIVHALRQGHTWGYGQHDVQRGASTVSRTSTSPSGSGAWDVRTTYGSRLFKDRLVGYGNFGNSAGGGGRLYDVSIAGLGSC